MKIVSLVPSASEILCDLGLERYLVGISHECNFPSSLQNIQTVTSSNIDSSETQIEIDTQVRKKVNDNKPLYEINSNILNKSHFCGPGNTYNEIKKILGDDSKNLTVELSYKEWKNNFFPSID